MSHCHDHHHHQHDHEDHPDDGEQTSLYGRVDRDQVRVLNEAQPGNGRDIIRPWNERMMNDKVGASQPLY